LRSGGRVERTRGKGIHATISRQTRDNRGDGNGNGKCCEPPSRDLAVTALVLVAEAVAVLIADDADGGNSGVAIVSSASLAAGGGVINLFHLVFVVDVIIFRGTPTMTMCLTENPTDALGVAATSDAPDGALPLGNTGEARDDTTNTAETENDLSDSSGNISCGACLPFWRITCMLVSEFVVR
jgi:hypothetical protein